MQQESNKSLWKEFVLVTVAGILLSRFSLGSVLMTLPLLLVAPRVKDLWQVLLGFAVVLIGTVTWTVIDYKSLIEAGYGSVLAMSLYLPVCTITGTAIWSVISRKSRAGLRKFFYSSLPVVVLGLGLAVWFSSEAASSTRELLKSSMLTIFSEENLGFSMESVVELSLALLNIVFVPMGMLVVGVPILIGELIMYRRDEAWLFDFAFMKLPDVFLGVFFGSWALALASSLISAIPMVLYCVAWNVALAMTVLYAIQGLSILVARFRRTSAYFSVGKIVLMVLILCLLPGVNLICLVGLPVLGILETWFRFR